MFEFVKHWTGDVLINGKPVDAPDSDFSNGVHITLTPVKKPSIAPSETSHRVRVDELVSNKQYKISVRAYMTKRATPEFDFMAKWNNNTPMPLRVMVGEVVKETRGMVYMTLHGDITEKVIPRCMRCGKPITNPVSQYFGMGPECGGHNYISPFDNEEDLKDAVETYKAKLRDIKWSGWIIRSAIESMEEV